MFSPEIVESEEFLSMPPSSQNLYFHLGMNGDDDGFIQPQKVMRGLGAVADDLKVLLSKRFLLNLEDGVMVIKHWLIHNMIRSDRYKPTRFQEQKKSLYIKENNAYTDNPDNGKPLLATKWQPNGNHLAPQVRLGKDSNTRVAEAPRVVYEIEREYEERPKKPAKYPHSKEVFSWFPNPQASWMALKNVQEREYAEYLYARGEEKVCGALAFYQKHKDDKFIPKIVKPSDLEKKWNDLVAYNP